MTLNYRHSRTGKKSSSITVENQVATDLSDYDRGVRDGQRGIKLEMQTPAYYEGYELAQMSAGGFL
jgi:hypothetical protein